MKALIWVMFAALASVTAHADPNCVPYEPGRQEPTPGMWNKWTVEGVGGDPDITRSIKEQHVMYAQDEFWGDGDFEVQSRDPRGKLFRKRRFKQLTGITMHQVVRNCVLKEIPEEWLGQDYAEYARQIMSGGYDYLIGDGYLGKTPVLVLYVSTDGKDADQGCSPLDCRHYAVVIVKLQEIGISNGDVFIQQGGVIHGPGDKH